jgi:hypothetical protein
MTLNKSFVVLNSNTFYANCMQMKNKKDFQSLESLSIISGEDRARTDDLLTASQAL